jgi:hypothetical protein
MMPRIYKCLDVASRLDEQSIPIPECGCIIWLGHLNNMGYGRLSVNGTMQYAHRAAFELRNGKIPKGSNVLHRCDTPTCINPDHLFVGTHADNVADKVSKGRQLRGSAVGGSKLTEADVAAIRASSIGVNETARRMGLSPMTVSLIRSRKTWRHVE